MTPVEAKIQKAKAALDRALKADIWTDRVDALYAVRRHTDDAITLMEQTGTLGGGPQYPIVAPDGRMR